MFSGEGFGIAASSFFLSELAVLGAKLKAVGAVLMLYGVVCLLVNFHLWSPPFIGGFYVLWNPVDALWSGHILGDLGGIPLIGDYARQGLSYLLALAYSFAVGVVALICLLIK